jgi:DNA-binding SARP family transcriptional activator
MHTEINLLGPLSATVAGTSIVPTAPKQRQVLALLALNVGSIVTVPAIMEEIWGDQPPRCPLASLQTYVLNLRRRLDQALAGVDHRSGKDILVTSPGGYVLEVPAADIDTARYEELAAAGRWAVNRGDNATAARTWRRRCGSGGGRRWSTCRPASRCRSR